MPNRTSPTGSELFIVDNSDTDWKVVRYLHDWCELSKSIDIATGYFEIGALLALKDEWQKVDKIRILMGDEVSLRTRDAFARGLADMRGQLDASIEAEKLRDDFLIGLPAIVDGIRSGKILCRVYRKDKFHAKAYITHARKEVVGSSALVGSSNFTYPGLTENIELNVQITGRPVAVLQEWYEEHWNEAEDVTAEILRVIERHTREYSPFEVYAKALHEYFRGERLEPDAWEARRSVIYKILDQYQKDGYHNLVDIAKVYNGALLCDGVGLGKTFIGLMLIERFALHENKNVLLLVPRSGRDSVWKPELARHLPQLSRGAFSSLEILNHTDLSATNPDLNDRIEAAKDRAHVVIIDEAHNFRNIGTRGGFTGDIPDEGPARGGKLIEGRGIVKPSRYRRLFDVIGDKPVFLLTATPVNNDLADLRHMIELFSRRKDDYFATKPPAISNLRSYFNELKKKLDRATQGASAEITDPEEAKAVLSADSLVSSLVVQRSRGYVKEHHRIHGGRGVLFPHREDPRVGEYSLKGVYGKLLTMIAEAFHKKKPLFSLPMYNPLNYLVVPIDKDDQDAQFDIGRQSQVVALIRTSFLKRLESSSVAFKHSCHRLLRKILAFIVTNVETASEKKVFATWQKSHKALCDELRKSDPELLELGKESSLFDDPEEDVDPLLGQSYLDAAVKYDRKVYRVGDMLAESMSDLGLLAQFLDELRNYSPVKDVKLQALFSLLNKDPVLRENKVLIFTEFSDTAEYLREQLIEADFEGVEAVDGSNAARDRVDVIRRFSPYYNRSTSAEAERAGGEIRVLVSTDVLSEGLNLQDATALINYDLHWNPVRLMQRIGRVDRRLNPEIEAKLLADHPEQADLRGKVCYWNFLPPDELNTLLTLFTRVTKKTLNISKTFGIEGRKLLRPDDDYDALKDFNAAYERKTRTEELALEYERLLVDHPGLAAKLDALPGRVFSGKAHPRPGTRAVFFCYALPVREIANSPLLEAPLFDSLVGEGRPEGAAAGRESEIASASGWSMNEAQIRWYLYDLAESKVLEPDPPALADVIRCKPDEPRVVTGDAPTLGQARAAVEKHIKNTYLKQAQAPVGIKPILKAWMELS